MLETIKNAIGLFFQGRLFADPIKFYRQLAIGVIVTAVVLVVGVTVGLPISIAALAAGMIGGALQPYLFKDLRYR